MATITEDYISYETAKLLKEKGFDIPCDYAYNNKASYFKIDRSNFDEVYCFRPSLAMAMKWLREVHKIHIIIHYSAFLYGKHPYYWSIYKIDTTPKANAQIEISTNTHDYSFVYYETACEAAIKYCLENLIQKKDVKNNEYDKDMLEAIKYFIKNNRLLEKEHIAWLESKLSIISSESINKILS